jgi:hypothetical protein
MIRQFKPARWLPIAFSMVLLGLANTIRAESAGENGDSGTAIDVFDSDIEETASGWPRFGVSAGIMSVDADGVLGVRPQNSAPVTIIDFDRVGLDEHDATHWLTLTWRARDSRWGAWFANWRYDVTGSREWDDELTLPGGDMIPVGATVYSSFDANWYIFEATYSFVQTRSVDAGLGFGFHVVDLETDLRALVEVGDGSTEILNGDIDTLAPLPNLVAYTYWKFLPRWSLTGRFGWFSLDYDKYGGQMTNAHVLLNYSFSPRFELGAGYQFLALDIDIERDRYREIYDIDFFGPMLFARVRF